MQKGKHTKIKGDSILFFENKKEHIYEEVGLVGKPTLTTDQIVKLQYAFDVLSMAAKYIDPEGETAEAFSECLYCAAQAAGLNTAGIVGDNTDDVLIEPVAHKFESEEEFE